MVQRFTASAPAGQNHETVRQFQALEVRLSELEGLAGARTYSGTIDGVPALDPVTWTTMVLTPAPMLDAWRYAFHSAHVMQGTGGAGWIQFRVSYPTGETVEGRVWDFDTNVARQMIGMFYVNGPGEFQAEVRGEDVTYIEGSYDTHAVAMAYR